MGSNTSKINPTQTAAETHKNDLDTVDNSDPRSPTPEITRTPLQGKTGGKHNITKNVDLRKTFENGEAKEKLIHNNPILSAVIKNHLQSYDPRSPTHEFERTPIIISSNVENDKLLRLRTENSCGSPNLQNDSIANCETAIDAIDICHDVVVPKNLCQGFYDLTLDDTFKDSEEPLGSSTASNDAIENNMSNGHVSKPTMLLETNFDYVEIGTEELDEVGENVNTKQDTDKSATDNRNVALFTILNEDPRSPSIGIERTPIVVANVEDTSLKNVEEMSDDTLIKVLQNTNLDLQNTDNESDKNTDGLLVYEDETSLLNETPKKSKSTTNSGSRTPLSCMKNKDAGHNRSKSANTLYASKNQKVAPCKMTKRTSHIPRLKSLSKQSKLLQTGSRMSLKNLSKSSAVIGDCENTPPHSHRDRWDKDSSIVL